MYRRVTGVLEHMTGSHQRTDGTRPAVYARLARDARHRIVEHTPPEWSRWMGRVLVGAIVVAILVTVLVAHPW
jgi:hypothetical protein